MHFSRSSRVVMRMGSTDLMRNGSMMVLGVFMVDFYKGRAVVYLTRRRVRYLYTNKLNDYGAWFKSGSLYRFSEKAERGLQALVGMLGKEASGGSR